MDEKDDQLDANPASGGGGEAASGGPVGREPTTREVNRADSAARKAAAKAARVAYQLKNVGVWREYVPEAVSAKKGLTAQINHLFGRVTVRSTHGNDRDSSHGTREKLHTTVVRAHLDLADLPEGRGVDNITKLRRVHVLAVVKYWEARGLSASTISSRISNLRSWLTRIGKPDIIPRGHEWEMILRNAGIDTRKLRRSSVAQQPKDWASKGVDAAALIEAVYAEDEIVGAQLDMQLAFGARVRESYSCNPILDAKGDAFYFSAGTKGGRPRKVMLDPDPGIRAVQLQVLERVQAVAAKHPKRLLARKGDSAKQTRNHFYYVCKKFGITRASLGIVAHGLRHQYIHQRYEGLTGLPAPVHNAVPAEAYRQLGQVDKDARLQLSQAVGHWRPVILGNYASTLAALTKKQQEIAMGYMKLIESSTDAEAAIREAGGTIAWLTNKAAQGLAIPDGEALVVAVLFTAAPSVEALGTLRAKLHSATGKPFKVSILLARDDVPDGSIELTLPSERLPVAAVH